MFLKVNTLQGPDTLVQKHINVLMCTVIHDITPDDKENKYGHKSVLYLGNGYACYSFLSADDIISAVQGAVVTETQVLSQLKGE